MQYGTHSKIWLRQVTAFAVVALVAALIVRNIAANLDQRGLALTFEFLGRPASFDIPFKLIEFTSRDTYGRAAVVALLNTMLVASLAIVTATVIATRGKADCAARRGGGDGSGTFETAAFVASLARTRSARHNGTRARAIRNRGSRRIRLWLRRCRDVWHLRRRSGRGRRRRVHGWLRTHGGGGDRR